MSQTESSARSDLRVHASISRLVRSRHQALDHIGVEPALDLLDAFVQRRLGVAVEDGHRLLGEDRAGVDLLGHEVHGAAGDLHAGGERVAHRVPALERGQQRRVRVHGPAAERVDERLGQDRAEPGHRDEIDAVAFERGDDLLRVRDPVEGRAEVGALDQLGRRPRPPGRRRGPPQGRSASTTTTGSRRSSIARRMVPLPEARTPTRMLAHPSQADSQVQTTADPRLPRPDIRGSTSSACFTRSEVDVDGRQRRRPGELTIMIAGAVMFVASFLTFAFGNTSHGARACSRSRPCSRSTA